MNFLDRLQGAIARNQSLLCLGLDPNPEMLPDRYNHGASPENLLEGLSAWLCWIIAETADLVCAYKPTLGFYTALGAPGLELLQQVLAAIPPHIPVILDAKHSDLNTSTLFAQTVFNAWQVDAVTLSPYAGQDEVIPFLVYPDKAVFVLCHTSNPAATALQEYPTPESPFYLQVVKQAKTWGTPAQLALEVGTTAPEVLTRIRTLAPERFILARSIWAEGSNLSSLLAAGLDANSSGLLVPVPQDLLGHAHPTDPIQSLRQEINQIRDQVATSGATCDLWLPNIGLSGKKPHQELILQLYEIGCLTFGTYVQASGATFPYYIDLRTIISNPQIFHKILNAYAEILKDLQFDRIAGIPYGSLPTATGLALHLHYPMIFPRKEVKAHGTRRLVEGHFQPGETVVVVDDILISGKSAIEGAEKLQSVGLKVKDIVVFIDHEQGVRDRLRERGYCSHAVLKISEIAETLYETNRITEPEFKSLVAEL
ncbi:MAG: bifunctional orotidine-5'-phosphate decarboxylase/orotate phosphoribosyltransferase [Leptolyngbyaceae bacterium]|nr:bifunctional orotidine-5'-phosphate decarboxylase/orotate phosphoribosyltransferase [Leptolyngbyaceae bacterium]